MGGASRYGGACLLSLFWQALVRSDVDRDGFFLASYYLKEDGAGFSRQDGQTALWSPTFYPLPIHFLGEFINVVEAQYQITVHRIRPSPFGNWGGVNDQW